jgi:hypothetical protein
LSVLESDNKDLHDFQLQIFKLSTLKIITEEDEGFKNLHVTLKRLTQLSKNLFISTDNKHEFLFASDNCIYVRGKLDPSLRNNFGAHTYIKRFDFDEHFGHNVFTHWKNEKQFDVNSFGLRKVSADEWSDAVNLVTVGKYETFAINVNIRSTLPVNTVQFDKELVQENIDFVNLGVDSCKDVFKINNMLIYFNVIYKDKNLVQEFKLMS